MASARFESPAPQAGFDPKLPWQMVPLRGSRAVHLRGAKDLRLEAPGAAAVVSYFEDNPTSSFFDFLSASEHLRVVTLRGLAPGSGTLEAKQPATITTLAKVQFSVLAPATINLKVYTVGDEYGHKTERSSESIAAMIRSASKMFESEANIKLVQMGGVTPLVLPGNQGEVFWMGPPEKKLLQSMVDVSSADIHLFLVWSLEVRDAGASETRNVMGYTPEGLRLCVIEDDACHSPNVKADAILAHELGHFLGLHHEDDDAANDVQNLMYFASTNGIKLAKAQVLTMNARAVAGTPAPILL